MATMELLHGGSFADYDGNEVTVNFYKIYNLNVVPHQLRFPAEGGTLTVSVWSTKGSAELTFRNIPDWITRAAQIKAEQLPGLNEYKYTYEITCSSNGTASNRSYQADVWIEAGEGSGYASRYLDIWQAGQGTQTSALSVVPSSIRYNVGGGTNGITCTWNNGTEPDVSIAYVNGEIGWLIQNGSGILSGDQKEWSFTASENDELIERQAVITVSNNLDSIAVPVRQNRQ